MKTINDHPDSHTDVDALLAAINEISESEVRRVEHSDDPYRVSVDGRDYHSCSELADAFELDIRDFSCSEITCRK